MLLPAIRSLRELSGRWWVAHTKARNEKSLAWDLIDRGIGYFLPLYQRTIFSGGRKRHGLMPLFASYVFICGDDDQRFRALRSGRICQMIDVPDQAGLIRELLMVERALAGAAPLDPYPFAAVGRRCRITRGPFVGIEGTVIRRDGVSQLVLQVGLLGRGAIMEIDTDLLEAAE